MKTQRKQWMAALGSWLVLTSLGCGADDGETAPEDQAMPVVVEGRIDELDEEEVSWEGLRLALTCLSGMTENDVPIYEVGDTLLEQEIGADGSFSLELPAPLDEAWFGSIMPQSAVFHFVAYNDTNQNGRLDLPEAGSEGPEDAWVLLAATEDLATGFFYARNPDSMNRVLKSKVALGWNYGAGLEFKHDFEREFVLGPLGQ